MVFKSFQELGEAFRRTHAEEEHQTYFRLVDRACDGEESALSEVTRSGLHRIPADRKHAVAGAFYCSAKQAIARRDFNRAAANLQCAHELSPNCWLYRERLHLTRAALKPGTIEWRASLIQLKADLRIPCPRDPCGCGTHFEIASCRRALEREFDHDSFLPGPNIFDGVTTYTVGHYFAWTRRTLWTRWLKAVKHAGQLELLAPISHIAADFLAERTSLLGDVDVLVPVPPDPEKYAKRGFAPTDILASQLGQRLALPCRLGLVRSDGGTRYVSYHALAAQFEVEPREAQYIKGSNVLLVEDIWTRGRTIPICATKLREAGAKEVFAVALGESTF